MEGVLEHQKEDALPLLHQLRLVKCHGLIIIIMGRHGGVARDM
jgi:hypothetical protein